MCPRESSALPSLSLNAPKVLEGSDEDLAVGNRQRGVRVLAAAELVDRQQLEFRIGREDHRFTTAHQDVKASVSVDHRTPVLVRGDSFFILPEILARLQDVAVRRAV